MVVKPIVKRVSSVEVLRGSIEADLVDVVVIGRRKGGELFIATADHRYTRILKLACEGCRHIKSRADEAAA